jgi:hypothetical protein
MSKRRAKPLSRSQFDKMVRNPVLRPIEEDDIFHNLASG